MGNRTVAIVSAAVVLASALLTGCVQDAADSEPVAFRSAWNKGKPDAFVYTLRRECYCREEYRGPFKVVANRDQVLHAIRLTDSGKVAVPEAELQSLSIDSVLSDLEMKLKSGYHAVLDDRNFEFGYPVRVQLDQREDYYDDEFVVSIDAFRVADPMP
jgi:hypothetical protein